MQINSNMGGTQMNWGVMATGMIAEKFARTISSMRSEGENIAAVGSRDKERAKAFAKQYGIEKAYGSYEEI